MRFVAPVPGSVRSGLVAGICVWWVIAGFVIACAPSAWAHGGGTVRARHAGAEHRVTVETDETPSAGVFGGTVHVTVIVTPAGQPTVRLRNVDVMVAGVGPGGVRVGPQRAELALNGAYEADLTVHDPGSWQFQVRVGTGDSLQVIEFPLDVLTRPWWSDLGVVGGLFLIPVLALSGMVRRSRRQHTVPGLREMRA